MQRPWGGQAWVTWKSEPTATLAEELRVRQTIWGLGMGMARIWEASGSDGPSVVLPLLKRVGRDLSFLLLQEVPPNLSHFFQEEEVTSFSWWPLAAASNLFLYPCLAVLSQTQDETWVRFLAANPDPAYCCVAVSRGPTLSEPSRLQRKEGSFEAPFAFPCMEKAKPPGSWHEGGPESLGWA